MATIKIVTDSSVQLTPEEVEKYNITVIPLSVMIDGTVYIDGKTITRPRFVELMNQSTALPKTSQPPIGEFIELFDQLGADGSQVIALHMTDAISGTVNTARQAANLSKSDVTVIDTRETDRGMAFQVLRAAQLAQSGADKETILSSLDRVRNSTKLYLAVMTLDNIVKGGRVSRVTGLISNILNMKVIFEMIDGELNVRTKGRGTKTVNNFMRDLIADLASKPNIKSIGISHVAANDVMEKFRADIHAALPNVPLLIHDTSPIIATYAGMGAFAIMYYTED
ncbi:DegV family protein [Loigolactobacillus coryniformis]|uniref:DegV family protein n=1 Tax=Loigolactobacillus coryniformis TaxID=1610 RepID=UPI001C5DCEB1|nr:DegV family protein [Loigolactobacillus coryniformis]MBW4802514.1 DegV family protein [Loigolactobacillus coryniformis subsp. torquens]MBW4805211.1 DegV family protein [Loigolactobacillus coryniformis subsp. torquens]